MEKSHSSWKKVVIYVIICVIDNVIIYVIEQVILYDVIDKEMIYYLIDHFPRISH